jgi:hypothetical protein
VTERGSANLILGTPSEELLRFVVCVGDFGKSSIVHEAMIPLVKFGTRHTRLGNKRHV